MQAARTTGPVLILGAGINGAALARELVLSGVDVVLVDQGDLAGGTTAYSSRLIHGGLRYLEYGELALVRESLAERNRWLQLAPHLVRPIELSIPLASRWSGLGAAAARFIGWRRWPANSSRPRGLIVVNAGMRLYDAYTGDRQLPPHQVDRLDRQGAMPVDPARYRWLCTYHDAQVEFPERLVMELLADARAAASASGVSLRIDTYHAVTRRGTEVAIAPVGVAGEPAHVCQPAAIVNATGAWVDQTLAKLDVPSPRMIGGTKGSHLFTFHQGLREALAGRGIYADAADGRPVFITPLAGCTLVGTTDQPFDGDPAQLAASPADIAYLLQVVRMVFPQLALTPADVAFSCCGVRPLPYVPAGAAGAITRRHWLKEHPGLPMPMYSIVGGKLTTCRSLAEQAARQILAALGRTHTGDSRERPLPGALEYPLDEGERIQRIGAIAAECSVPLESVRHAWKLWGTRAGTVLAEARELDRTPLPDEPLPAGIVDWLVANELVARLEDLVERRLMLLYRPRITRRLLAGLAERLVRSGVAPAGSIDEQCDRVERRLGGHFGRQVEAPLAC